MGVFETHDAKKKCVGCGLAPQTPTLLHTMGQKRCVWVPRMVVFETHDAKKNCVGSGVALHTTHSTVPHGPEKVFLGT